MLIPVSLRFLGLPTDSMSMQDRLSELVGEKNVRY